MIICASFIRLDKDKIHSNLEILLYSLGLGPVFTTLILYYLLLFCPHYSNFFYLLAVFTVYLALLVFGRKSFVGIWAAVIDKLKIIKSSFKVQNKYQKIKLFICTFILIVFLASVLFLFLTNTLQTPVSGTDALRYGTMGKIIFTEKSLEYKWAKPYTKTGFYVRTHHAPSFSLFLTWKKIIDSIFNAEKDYYYKSISAYYTLLIIGILIFWLSKKSKYLALIGVFSLLSSFTFFQTLITLHLDSFRVFLLTISWIYLAYALEKKDSLSFLLLGIYSGFAAFAHSIGAILVVFSCFALFIFIKGGMKYRFTKTGFVILITIAFGWFHYILDIIWGYGWIIFNRGITWWG